MLGLIRAELYKITHKKIVLAGIILVAVLNHVLYGGLMVSTNVMREDGTYASGAEAIALDQEIAGRYEGALTEEKIQRMLEEFALPEGFHNTDYPVGYISRNNMYAGIFEFYDENGTYNGTTVEDVYGAQAEHIQVAYNESWSNAGYYLSMFFMLGIAYLLIVSVTPVFAEEYSRGMDALILTSRYGKNRCAIAKVAAVFLYTLLLSAVFLIVNTALFLVNYGLAGANGSLQFNYLGIYRAVPYEIHFAQAGVYAVCLWFGAVLLLSGICLLVSAYSKSSFAALILCALVYTVPLSFSGKGRTNSILLSLFPIQQMNLLAPFAVEPIGGAAFSFIVAGGSIAAALLLGLLAKRGFSRHQVNG